MLTLRYKHSGILSRQEAALPRCLDDVDAALAPQRKTGQIKLHGPAAFEGMRKAGRLVAECLDMLGDEVRPGVPTEKIDRLVFDLQSRTTRRRRR